MSGSAQDAVNPVGFTSQVTAAFRAVELKCSDSPIIVDPLAEYLGKAAWETAYNDWQHLVQLQGPGKSLRVPARNRLMDDLLRHALQQLSDAGHQQVQVVNIGCGMDSKPWRLQLPVNVTWFDVDQPAVMQCKQELLAAAGAAANSTAAQPPPTHPNSSSASSTSMQHAAGASTPCSTPEPEPPVQFPLLVEHWRPVAADLSQTSLAACLHSNGFACARPTVWLSEALLYYLPLEQALHLLADMRALSAPDSMLIATCIDRELYIADHERMDKGHYFHAMWHFHVDGLLGKDQQQLQGAGWALDMQPSTTADLAQQRYGRATYVPVYGGAECIFSAVLHAD